MLLCRIIVTYRGSYTLKGWKGDKSMRLLLQHLTMPVYQSMTLRKRKFYVIPINGKEVMSSNPGIMFVSFWQI